MYHFTDEAPVTLAPVTESYLPHATPPPDTANRFLRFLLSEQAQSFAATRVNEYPVVSGASVPDYLMPADEALKMSPEFDLQKLQNMEPTLDLLRDAGAL